MNYPSTYITILRYYYRTSVSVTDYEALESRTEIRHITKPCKVLIVINFLRPATQVYHLIFNVEYKLIIFPKRRIIKHCQFSISIPRFPLFPDRSISFYPDTLCEPIIKKPNSLGLQCKT